MQLLEKLERKEVDRLRAAGKDVMHNIVEAPASRVIGQLLSVAGRVGQDGLVVLAQVKVLFRKGVHNWVNLDDGGVDAMRH